MVPSRGSKVEPLIALSAPRIVRCGDFGHETVVKILTNMLCAVQDCAMGEVMMIAKKCGVDLKLFLILIQMALLHIHSPLPSLLSIFRLPSFENIYECTPACSNVTCSILAAVYSGSSMQCVSPQVIPFAGRRSLRG